MLLKLQKTKIFAFPFFAFLLATRKGCERNERTQKVRSIHSESQTKEEVVLVSGPLRRSRGGQGRSKSVRATVVGPRTRNVDERGRFRAIFSSFPFESGLDARNFLSARKLSIRSKWGKNFFFAKRQLAAQAIGRARVFGSPRSETGVNGKKAKVRMAAVAARRARRKRARKKERVKTHPTTVRARSQRERGSRN